MKPFAKRPWLLVVVAFITLVAAWAATIIIAEVNRPVPVPLHAPRGGTPPEVKMPDDKV